jgi:hypothetical protein
MVLVSFRTTKLPTELRDVLLALPRVRTVVEAALAALTL